MNPLHILFLTQILPYPPDSGPRVKTWHVLRYLAEKGHRITLVTYLRPDEAPHLPAVEGLGVRVIPVPIRRSRLADAWYFLRSSLAGKPFLIDRDDLPGMRRAVADVLRSEPVDVIHADQLGMAQFALRGRDLPGAAPRPPAILFDSHNAVWMIVERMAENAFPPLRPFLRLEARRIRRYEADLLRRFDETLTVTDIDRDAMLSPGAAAERVTTIPIAVDTARLQPTRRRPGVQNLLTLGTLYYPPNADGIRWFIEQVYPLVRQRAPGACLTIIGKNPPPDFLEAAGRDPSISVTGYVPDLEPCMEAAAVVVVPVRAGGGMRVRILEAFARGMPVVTTTVGLEGIAAEPGREVLVADDPAGFAEAVCRVLASPELQDELARNGRRLAETRYDWQMVLRRMDAVYARLGKGSDHA